MMGQHSRTEPLFHYFRLEDQIPEDHLLKRLDRCVDFRFVRERLRDAYSTMTEFWRGTGLAQRLAEEDTAEEDAIAAVISLIHFVSGSAFPRARCSSLMSRLDRGMPTPIN